MARKRRPKPPASLPARSKSPAPQPPAAIQAMRVEYQGPLPDGETLEHYERTLPGAAKTLFDQFKKQGNHRRFVEKMVVFGEYGLRFGSQIAATVIGLGFAALSGYLITQGHDASGLLMFGTSVVGLVSVNKKSKGS